MSETVKNTAEVPIDSKYSLGTQAALTAITTQLESPRNNFDTIVVNVATLIRNRVRKELVFDEKDTAKNKQMKFNTLYTETKSELTELITELTLALQQLKMRNAAIVVYCPDYLKSIPIAALREQTATRVVQNEVATRMAIEILPAMTGAAKAMNDINVYQLAMISNVIPWKILARSIMAIRSTHHLLLVSHQPVDFHIGQRFKDLLVVESYTGKLKSVKELGDKVFDNDPVPFIPCTHSLLGDSHLILSPWATKEKKELYALAENERWQIKTAEYVRQSVMRHGFSSKMKVNLE